jgi:hypothetical protein
MDFFLYDKVQTAGNTIPIKHTVLFPIQINPLVTPKSIFVVPSSYTESIVDDKVIHPINPSTIRKRK